MQYWVILANTNAYRLYSYDKAQDELKLLKDVFDASGKLQDKDLVTDRPGHYNTAFTARGAYESSSAKDHEIDIFLHDLAKTCEAGRLAHHVDRIILIAAPKVNGIFMKYLDKSTQALVTDLFKKDYMHFTQQELQDFLRTHWEDIIFFPKSHQA